MFLPHEHLSRHTTGVVPFEFEFEFALSWGNTQKPSYAESPCEGMKPRGKRKRVHVARVKRTANAAFGSDDEGVSISMKVTGHGALGPHAMRAHES